MRNYNFQQGRFSPCVYHHRTKPMVFAVHGDDYVTSGEVKNLEWLNSEISKRFESKAVWFGPDGGKHNKRKRRYSEEL